MGEGILRSMTRGDRLLKFEAKEDTPLPYLSEMVCECDPRWQEAMTRVREAKSLALMVMAVWVVVRLLAVRLLEEELALRAEAPVRWPACEHCGRRRHSKGFRERR